MDARPPQHREPPKKSTSLSSRISKPGSKTAPPAASKKATARRAAALDRMDVDVNIQKQVNVRSQGISIRGIAGPFTVVGQNFAPGTTAADIESVLTPFGGHMESCKIVKTKPFVVAEMVFASKEGGDRVIETFNNKTADGRLLKVYPKIGGNKPASNQANTNGQVVDGSMGFSESSQSLYSDRLLNGNEGRGQRNRGRR
uniref:RRM domain-containing protein n=1 Tax=Bionectria ochroleuca TaxID=29856 RepID=A0A8H7K5I4_BIOOC